MEHGKFPKVGLETALHAPTENGDVKLVGVLLDHGARSDLRDSLGRTPYDWAKAAKLMNQSEVLVILRE
jgi:ankyrin repeat protein